MEGKISGELTDIVPELAQHLVLKEELNGNFEMRWQAKVRNTRREMQIHQVKNNCTHRQDKSDQKVHIKGEGPGTKNETADEVLAFTSVLERGAGMC